MFMKLLWYKNKVSEQKVTRKKQTKQTNKQLDKQTNKHANLFSKLVRTVWFDDYNVLTFFSLIESTKDRLGKAFKSLSVILCLEI